MSGWRTAVRDDGLVAEELHESRAMDRVYPLSEAAFFDEFFRYIDEIGARPLPDCPEQGRPQRTRNPHAGEVTAIRSRGGRPAGPTVRRG